MNLHEYQAKELLSLHGITVLPGKLCETAEAAAAAAIELGTARCLVKAQVHAGGRGKAGGIKIGDSPEKCRAITQEMIGMKLVTKQTGQAGKLVRKVYLEAACEIAAEFYLSVTVNRARRCLSLIASAEGGVEIEEVAASNPEKILAVDIDSGLGLLDFQAIEVGFKLGLDAGQARAFAKLSKAAVEMFLARDLSLLEINPLALTAGGDFIPLDAKCSIDDNALFRHKDLHSWLDQDEVDARELRAAEFGLSYVALDGNIGCMVNGAGLAMATMDIIKLYGGSPANFLDVGGGASREAVTEAFRILVSDSSVKGILVNIFGGIVKCDVIAGGISDAAKDLQLKVPLVVRLQGTNVEQGNRILAESGLKIESAASMAEAAAKIVEMVSV